MEKTREAWRSYVSTGALAPDRLREPVYRAWERSHLQKADPRRPRAELLSALDTARLLDQEAELISAARPYLCALSRAAGADRHAAMLSDRRAVVLDVVGDEASVHGPERVPEPGALCSESACGANGLGSPLAEGAYVELVGPEHFIEGFHPFTCQGIPIRDASGETVGALSSSVRRPDASRRLRDVLVCAARGVEAELLRRRMERGMARVLTARPGDASALEALRQDVVQTQTAARLKLETAARMVPGDRFQYALTLLELANGFIERFSQRARLWEELADDTFGTLMPVDVTATVRELVDLLDTEAAMHEVRLVLEEGHHQAAVIAATDRRSLRRGLLRFLLEAIREAGRGGAVDVRVHPASARSHAEVQIQPRREPRGGKGGAAAALRLVHRQTEGDVEVFLV